MARLFTSVVVVAAMLAVMTPTQASAMYTYDKLAFLTFSGPVQVPGATLNAGTYRFRLTNAEGSRNILQVLSNDGKTVHAMFQTTPEWRVLTTKDPVLTFRETEAGVPAAAKSMFYGGEHNGYQFVYPKGFPITKAPVVPQPEITYALTPAPAPAPVAKPEVRLAPAAEPAPAVEPAPEQAPVAAPAPPAELPRTASPLPLVAVGGFSTLLAGLGLGLLRKRVN